MDQKYFVVERQSDDAEDRVVYPVSKVLSYNGGYAFEYMGRDKMKDVVYIPKQYPFVRRNGAVYVGKVSGNNSAAALTFGPVVGGSVDPYCPGEDLSMLVRTDLMARGYRTIYQKNIPWKAVLLIGGVVVLVVVVVILIRGGFGAG